MNARSYSAIAGVATAVVVACVMPAAAGTSAAVTGSGHGTWQSHVANPDTGVLRTLHGHGQFDIGAATVTGTVSAPGFIAKGDCGVTLRLVTATGSVTLSGHSKLTASSYPTCLGPFRFSFHSAKATGKLAGKDYQGVGRLNLANASADATDHGTFTLKLSPLR